MHSSSTALLQRMPLRFVHQAVCSFCWVFIRLILRVSLVKKVEDLGLLTFTRGKGCWYVKTKVSLDWCFPWWEEIVAVNVAWIIPGVVLDGRSAWGLCSKAGKGRGWFSQWAEMKTQSFLLRPNPENYQKQTNYVLSNFYCNSFLSLFYYIHS